MLWRRRSMSSRPTSSRSRQAISIFCWPWRMALSGPLARTILAKPPASLTGLTALAAGGLHSLALSRSGAVIGWGDNTYGQITIPPSATNVLAIAAGYAHSLALRADGTVVRWGRGGFTLNSTLVPPTISPVSLIAAGYTQNAAVGRGSP